MKKEITNKPASVLAKLRNFSIAENIDYNHILLRYCQERFLYRLSVSQYAKNFYLKGGLFLICLNVPSARATKDIDFLARQISGEVKELESVIANIANLEYADGVKFVTKEITSKEIVETGDYPGIRVRIPALIGKARVPIQLDFAWGDIVKPKERTLDFPTILEDEEQLRIIAYSTESAISEKFQATVKLGTTNSRMKDFYDIYMLSLSQSFKSKLLGQAIEATFKNRRTELSNDLLIFQLEFKKNITMQDRWLIFLNKHKLEDVPKDFPEVMSRITSLLRPLVTSILDNNEIDDTWDSAKAIWKPS